MKKNNIYLATNLYSFFDRKTSVVMYNSILNSKKFGNDNIYLPFKDSNMKVSTVGNVAKNIFEADIKSLNNTDVFITRLDGTSYAAGVGFEIGYCLAKRGHFIFLILISIKINYQVILNISYLLLWIKLLIYLNMNI